VLVNIEVVIAKKEEEMNVEDCKTIRAVSESKVLRINNAFRRLILRRIDKVKGRRSEFQADLIRTKVVEVRSRLDCSLEVLELILILNRSQNS
jgi:hypothetical protein